MEGKSTNSDLVSNGQAIAQFVADSASRHQPPAVLDAARMCLVDWVGVCTGAQAERAGHVVRSVANAWAQRGRSTLMLGGQSGAAAAALCNGTLAHCLDFDDTFVKSNTHTSAPLWAATLALGEETGASEYEMLSAFITGFHATGVFGRLAASAACAALLKLDAEAVQHALGAAATQASGLTASFGTMSKPFHAGKAAMDGVLSAQLAAAGFKAATCLLEPHGGLDSAIIQDKTAAISPADFSDWEILNNSFKPYAACHLTHPSIDAARAAGLDLGDIDLIDSVQVQLGALAHQITGGKTGAPSSSLEGKFDLKYCVALALHGRPLSAADFTDPMHGDEHVRATAAKVHSTPNMAMGYSSAQVKVILRGGGMRTVHVPVAKGHPGNPMTWEDMQTKFEGLVKPVAGTRTREIFERLREFGTESGRGLGAIRMLSAAVED